MELYIESTRSVAIDRSPELLTAFGRHAIDALIA